MPVVNLDERRNGKRAGDRSEKPAADRIDMTTDDRNEPAAGELDHNGPEGGVPMPYSFPRRPQSRLNSQPDPINWRRGLIRVWLLVSAAWIMAWIIYLILYGLRGGFSGPGDVITTPILLLGPPIALLLFGLAAGWAFRGFNIEDKSEPK